MQVRLNAIGIKTADDLFNAAVTPAGRQELAECAGVPVETILELANRADLARIKGTAGVYSDLLEEAGVDTIKELKARVPGNLHAKMLEINTIKNLPKPPALKTVKTWIALARRRRKF